MTSLPNNSSGSVLLSPSHGSVNGGGNSSNNNNNNNNISSLSVSPISNSPPLNNYNGSGGAAPQSPTYFSPNGSLSPNTYSGSNNSSGSPELNISEKRKSDSFNENKLKTRSQSSEDLKSISDEKKKKLFVTPKLIAPNKKSSNSSGGSTSSDEPPISKTLEGRVKSDPYTKKFKLPGTEILLHDYSAALFRQILLHGRIYLFTNYICFESKIFGIKTSEVIPVKDIVQIKKKSRFTVGIEILTNKDVKYSFASFVSRDKAYKDLLEVWKDVTGETHEDASSLSVDDDIDDEISNSELDNQPPQQQQSYENVNNNYNNVQQQQQQQTQQNNEPIITTTEVISNNSNSNSSSVNTSINGTGRATLTHSQTKIDREQVVAIISTLQHEQQAQQQQQQHDAIPVIGSVATTSTVTATATATSISTSTTNVPTATSSSPAVQPITSSTSTSQSSLLQPIKEVEKSPLDDAYGCIDQYLSKKDQQPQASILESQHSDFQEILSDNFNVSVVNFYRALYSDKCNFVHNYHVKRGDMNVNVKPWTFRERFGTIRELEYVAPVSSPIGPDKTRIQETQRYHLTKTKLIVETDTIMLDIPYGDHFRIEAKWDIAETSPDTCRLTIQLCVRFIKKTWFKSKIETTTIKETKTSFDKWMQLAKVEIQKMLQIKSSIPASSSSKQPNHNGLVPPNVVIPSLNKSMDKTELSRLRGGVGDDNDRLDSPKPHHSRSRSRQHLISSSNQVNSSPNSSNPVLATLIQNSPMNLPNPSPSVNTQMPPISPYSLSTNNNGADNTSGNNDTSDLSSQQPTSKDLFKSSSTTTSDHKKDENIFASLKTPFGTLSFSSSQFSILVVCGLLLIIYSYMFMKILTLSSKIDTMESIFKDLVNKNLNK